MISLPARAAQSAACWAALVSIGADGYTDAARRILEAAATIRAGIDATDGVHVLGDPLFCVAFATDEDPLDVYRVMDAMGARGWSLNGLHHPPAVHICTTLRHARAGVPERFVADLGESVAQVRGEPASDRGMAPIYGMAATLPDRGVVESMIKGFVDLWYRP